MRYPLSNTPLLRALEQCQKNNTLEGLHFHRVIIFSPYFKTVFNIRRTLIGSNCVIVVNWGFETFEFSHFTIGVWNKLCKLSFLLQNIFLLKVF